MSNHKETVVAQPPGKKCIVEKMQQKLLSVVCCFGLIVSAGAYTALTDL